MDTSFLPTPGPRVAVAATTVRDQDGSESDRIAVLVVDAEGIVEHYGWSERPFPDPGSCQGPQALYGVHAIGRPAAVAIGGECHVFVRTDQDELVWTLLGSRGFTGWTVLAKYLAFDPVASSFGSGRVDLMARSVTGDLRHWTYADGGWRTEARRPWGCGSPAVIAHQDSGAVYGVAGGGVLREFHYRSAGDEWIARPDVAAGVANDVVAIGSDHDGHIDLFGNGSHWGYWPHGNQWIPDLLDQRPRLPAEVLGYDVGPVTGGYALVARDHDLRPMVVDWMKDDSSLGGTWRGDRLPGYADELPVAVALRRAGACSVVFFDHGVLTHVYTGRGQDRWESVQWTGPAADDFDWQSGARARPDYLVGRGEDLVHLGVSSSGMLVDPGPPTTLVAGANASLLLAFPPQHIAEEVVDAGQQLPPGSTLRGRPAGVSQLAFHVPEGTRIPLTVEGVLTAVTAGGLNFRPGTPGNPASTVVELPWQLAFTPSDVDVLVEHSAVPQAGADGAVALWSTAVRRASGEPMHAQPLDASVVDPFRMGLGGGARSLIRALASDQLVVNELRLSALGGLLDVSGQAPGFGWRHRAALGRDQTVRVVWHGTLLPLGLRATYTEDSDRQTRPDEGEGEMPEPIAALRKIGVLTVIEPVRTGRTSRFPFDRIEIAEVSYGGLVEPDWQPVQRQVDVAGLTAALDRTNAELQDWVPTPDGAVVELVAESDDRLQYYLWLVKTRALTEQAIAAGGYQHDVEVVFRPATAAGPIAFRVKASASGNDLEFAMPLAFVADVELPAQFGLAAYTSRGNPDVLATVRKVLGSSEVGLPAILVDLRPDLAAADDRRERPVGVQEVYALNFGATPSDAGFEPTLGWPTTPFEGQPDWAALIGLPATRQLTGDDAPVRIALPPPERAADVIVDLVEGRSVLFENQADRIGGLATPSFTANALSVAHGLVSDAGLQPGPAGIDPKLLLNNAKLLGADLAALIDRTKLHQPPQLTGPPVTYQWGPVDLIAGAPEPPVPPPALVPLAGATMTITVAGGTTISKLTNVSLRLPADDPLIVISFASLEFTQSGSESPTLRVGNPVTATFQGALQLLSELASRAGLDSTTAAVVSSSEGISVGYRLPIPEASCGAFSLRNATFSAEVQIPFKPPGVRIVLGFASRAEPFALSILALGGGGYVRAVLNSGAFGDKAGVEELEIALEFGALLAVNLGIARAEVQVVGGIRLVSSPSWTFTGYIRLGGSVELLGLISVVVELRLELSYDMDDNTMWGRATMRVELDLTLTSFDVELDTGTWVLVGGDGNQADDRGNALGSTAFARRYAGQARGELA